MRYDDSLRNLLHRRSPRGRYVVLRDVSSQVTIKGSRTVHPNTIAEALGLRDGVALSENDLQARRDELLRNVPNLKSVAFEFKQPDGLVVSAEDRMPVARIGVVGRQNLIGRVTDDDGVVFIWTRETSTLPLIREREDATTSVGHQLTGRSAAALELLITFGRSFGRSNVSVLEVDTSSEDRLDALLSTGAKLKIDWDGMDEPPSVRSAKDLGNRLEMLSKAMLAMSESVEGSTWNLLNHDRVYFDRGTHDSRKVEVASCQVPLCEDELGKRQNSGCQNTEGNHEGNTRDALSGKWSGTTVYGNKQSPVSTRRYNYDFHEDGTYVCEWTNIAIATNVTSTVIERGSWLLAGNKLKLTFAESKTRHSVIGTFDNKLPQPRTLSVDWRAHGTIEIRRVLEEFKREMEMNGCSEVEANYDGKGVFHYGARMSNGRTFSCTETAVVLERMKERCQFNQ